MADQNTGYTEAAEALDTRQETYEELAQLKTELPNGYRATEIYTGNDYEFVIEKETEYSPYWLPVAEFTEPDAKYEWAEELAGELSDGYRTVVDHSAGAVYVEALITED